MIRHSSFLVVLLFAGTVAAQSKVDYESATSIQLVGDDGETLSLTIRNERFMLGGVEIDRRLAVGLIAAMQAWRQDGNFASIQPAQRVARGYTLQEAADEWRRRYLANPGPQRLTNGTVARAVIGVGSEGFHLNGVARPVPYAAAAAHLTWQSDGAVCGVSR